MTRVCSTLALLLAIAAPSAGCFPTPTPDRTRFFVLSSIPEAQERFASPSNGDTPLIGLGPVVLPDYLDRRELVRRMRSNRLDVSPTDRWAEPLEASVKRVLYENLATLLATRAIVVYPWSARLFPDCRIEIEILRFEPDGSGTGLLEARWAIRRATEPDATLWRETRLERAAPGGDAEAQVGALSSLLGELSREIASSL